MKRIFIFVFLCAFFFLNAQENFSQTMIAKSDKKNNENKIRAMANKLEDDLTVKNYLETLDIYEKAKNLTNEPQNSEAFLELKGRANKVLNSISAKIVSAPKTTEKGKSFSSNFSVQYLWTSTKTPVPDLPISISVPADAEKSNGKTETIKTKTDENGMAAWNAATPQFSQRSDVKFSVADQDEYLFLSIPYVVSTSYKSAGGSIAIVDYTKDGRPIGNSSLSSSRLLALLMNSGFVRIGNSDFVQQVVSDNADAVQRAATALFGKSTTYLIYGTIEYEDVKNDGGEFTVALKSNLRVRHLLENRELLRTSFSESATGNTESAAYQAAREKICQAMHDAVTYGM